MDVRKPHLTNREQLAEICRRTLADWPEARAAVLFGSRARGDHRPDSDWDVTVILEGDAAIERTSRFPAENVDAWTVGTETLAANAGDLGRLPCAIALDGQLLAGDWQRPKPKEKVMNPDDWLKRMEMIIKLANEAICQYQDMAQVKKWADCEAICRVFIRTGSDAAERLVKAVMERRGVRADLSHDIIRLADSFADARPKERRLAMRMKALNGNSKDDHQADYVETPLSPDDCGRAVRRLVDILGLLAREMESDPDDGAMKGIVPEVARYALDKLHYWKQTLELTITPKSKEISEVRLMAQTLLDGREEVMDAVTGLEASLTRLRPASATASQEVDQ